MKLQSDKDMRAVRAVFPDEETIKRVFAENAEPVAKMTWRNLADTRHALVACNRTLLAKIEAESDAAKVKGLEEAFDAIDAAVQAHQREMNWRDEIGNRGPRDPQSGRGMPGSSEDRGSGFRDNNTGAWVRSYRSNERLSDGAEFRGERQRIMTGGDVMFRVLRGRWPNAEVDDEARAMSIGTNADGGYFVPSPLSTMIIDAARAASACMSAGVQTIVMDNNTLDLSRIENDPLWTWKAELASASSSAPVIGRVRMQSRTVLCLIPISIELADDATPNLANTLDGLLTRSLAAELDRVMIQGGTGSPNQEPTGLLNISGLGSYTYGGTIADYSWVSHGVETVQTANLAPNAMVSHPKVYGTLDRLVDTRNQPLQPPRSFENLKHYPTTNVPTDLGSPSESCAFVAKFDEAVLAVRKNLEIRVARDGTVGTVNATTDYAMFIVAAMRLDFAVLRPGAFCVVKGLGVS